MTSIESPDILACGEWRPRGLIKVWVDVEPPTELKDVPTYDPAELIACPTCRARMTEYCQRASGSRRAHESRLVRRVCACGGAVHGKQQMCTYCRIESTREAAA